MITLKLKMFFTQGYFKSVTDTLLFLLKKKPNFSITKLWKRLFSRKWGLLAWYAEETIWNPLPYVSITGEQLFCDFLDIKKNLKRQLTTWVSALIMWTRVDYFGDSVQIIYRAEANAPGCKMSELLLCKVGMLMATTNLNCWG